MLLKRELLDYEIEVKKNKNLKIYGSWEIFNFHFTFMLFF